MTNPDRPMRVLMSADTARHLGNELSRRRLFGLAGSAALAAFLASCGDDDDDDAGGSGTTAPAAATGDDTAPTTAPAAGNGDANSFNLFTWAEYDDPEVLEEFGDIQITIYNSNEEAIQKLVAAGGNGGYDVMCPTGVFIPQLVSEGLLHELDLSRIPNFANLEAVYTNQPWDPGNKHSVCKDWGTTGWIYDTTVISREITTWTDFIDVAMNEASGNVSVLDAPNELAGLYFWANGIDWNTTDPAHLAAFEEFMVNEFASHIKAFDSYPGINLTQGNYALSMIWNGDARQGLVAIQEAGGDPADYKWATGAPTTELWMDNWCILKDAANLDAAYNFLNYILDPAISAREIAFHGYNTGVAGSRELLPPETPFLDMVYFTDEEVGRMVAGSIDNQDAVVDVYNKVKAAAGA
jgi:spermidine/putrescine transport system substrate-binding protein